MIRVAVTQTYARPHRPVAAGDEIALFPPVSGG
ncbi:MAG: MoaD/ThiS family protein [Rhodospirillaceae bacterium]